MALTDSVITLEGICILIVAMCQPEIEFKNKPSELVIHHNESLHFRLILLNE
jgi:hypothetical protein